MANTSNLRLPHVCILVFAVSFFAFAMLPEGRLSGVEIPHGGEAVRVAWSLLNRGTFSDPFAAMPTGPTAHVAPVYPFLYAMFLKVFGAGYASLLILWGVNIGFMALQMAMLPWISSRLGIGMMPGIVAAALGSVSAHTRIDTEWECFFVGLFLMTVCLLTWRASTWGTFPRAVLLGVVWGVLILSNPLTVLLLVAWPLIVVAAHPRAAWRLMGARSVAMICAAMLTVAPWIARNHARFGAFIFVRDNLGLELATGNNPCAAATLVENVKSGCHHTVHPNSSPRVAKNVAAVGEYAFDQAKLRQAVTWIDGNRAAFLRLTLQRFRQFWFPTLERRWEELIVWPVTLLSAAGIVLLWRKNALFARLILVTWILFPVIYYLVPGEARYRYPIYWTMLLPAGCALADVLARIPIPRFLPILSKLAGRRSFPERQTS
jgi:hypothetical protein